MAYITNFAYASDEDDVSSHTGIIPPYDVGDLLVWMVHKDSTAGSHLTTPDGWTTGIARSDINEVLICYKTAEADETAPTTSSDDTDAYQSTMLVVKGCSGVGEIFHTKNTDAIPETIETFNADSNSNIGGLSIVWASWSSTGGGTISPFGFNIVNEESTSLAMTINAFPINNLNDTPDINLQSSTSKTFAFYQFELFDDGNEIYECSVNNNITMIENNINGPTKSNTGNLSLTSINSIPIDDTNTVINDAYTDRGVSYIQKAVYVKVAQGKFFSGVEFTFTDTQDFATNNPLFLFNIYTDRPKYKPPIGNGQDGVFIYIIDDAGNWKAWNIDAADAKVKIITQDLSFILDLLSTTFMDSNGTLDLSTIKKIGFGQLTRSIAYTYFDVSRMYLITHSSIYGGSSNIPANIDSLIKFQTGAIMNVFKKQGNNILTHIPLKIANGIDTIFYDKGTTLAFPIPYNLNDRYLNFHCRNNIMGVEFNLTANSDVKFENFTFTGGLKYYFNSISNDGVLNFVGVIFENIGNNSFTSNITITNSTFLDCDTINCSDTNISNTTFNNTTLYTTNFDVLSELKFINYQTAIYIPASVTGTITFDNIQVDGSGTDVYWDGTSDTLTINCINGTNITTSNSNGGTVSIQNIRNFTFTLNPNITHYEYRIYQVDALGSLTGAIELQGIEDADTNTYTYSYNYDGTDIVIAVQILPHANDYVESETYYTLSNTNQSVIIDLEVDINN